MAQTRQLCVRNDLQPSSTPPAAAKRAAVRNPIMIPLHHSFGHHSQRFHFIHLPPLKPPVGFEFVDNQSRVVSPMHSQRRAVHAEDRRRRTRSSWSRAVACTHFEVRAHSFRPTERNLLPGAAARDYSLGIRSGLAYPSRRPWIWIWIVWTMDTDG